MKKTKKPQIGMTEVEREIQIRTGLPLAAIKKVLKTYGEIVKECVVNEVEVTFCDLGYFGWRHRRENLNQEYMNFQTGKREVKDFPAHNIMSFRQKGRWRKEMKELTIPLFLKEGEKENT